LVLEVYAKRTRQIPKAVIARCKKRLRAYDNAAKEVAAKKAATPAPKKGKDS